MEKILELRRLEQEAIRQAEEEELKKKAEEELNRQREEEARIEQRALEVAEKLKQEELKRKRSEADMDTEDLRPLCQVLQSALWYQQLAVWREMLSKESTAFQAISTPKETKEL